MAKLEPKSDEQKLREALDRHGMQRVKGGGPIFDTMEIEPKRKRLKRRVE